MFDVVFAGNVSAVVDKRRDWRPGNGDIRDAHVAARFLRGPPHFALRGRIIQPLPQGDKHHCQAERPRGLALAPSIGQAQRHARLKRTR
jgi:hypothetical protein